MKNDGKGKFIKEYKKKIPLNLPFSKGEKRQESRTVSSFQNAFPPLAKGVGGFFDFGVRKYDEEIGRFTTMEPLLDKYPQWSPYQYSANNPVNAVDRSGFQFNSPSCSIVNKTNGPNVLRGDVDAIQLQDGQEFIDEKDDIRTNKNTEEIATGDQIKIEGPYAGKLSETVIPGINETIAPPNQATITIQNHRAVPNLFEIKVSSSMPKFMDNIASKISNLIKKESTAALVTPVIIFGNKK